MLGRLLTRLMLAAAVGLAGEVLWASPVAPALAAPAPAAPPPAGPSVAGTVHADTGPAVTVEALGRAAPPARPATEPAPTTTPPEIATRSALVADAPVRESARPVSVDIGAVGVTAPVVGVGVDAGSGQLAIPADADTVVWYEHGPAPGETGSAVLAGHVDYDGRPGVFYELGDVSAGSTITVTYEDGSATVFDVVDVRDHAKTELPTSELFRRHGDPVLVLITCGGEFDRDARSYRSNIAVTAVPSPGGPAGQP